jgi:hypothetical protein
MPTDKRVFVLGLSYEKNKFNLPSCATAFQGEEGGNSKRVATCLNKSGQKKRNYHHEQHNQCSDKKECGNGFWHQCVTWTLGSQIFIQVSKYNELSSTSRSSLSWEELRD